MKSRWNLKLHRQKTLFSIILSNIFSSCFARFAVVSPEIAKKKKRAEKMWEKTTTNSSLLPQPVVKENNVFWCRPEKIKYLHAKKMKKNHSKKQMDEKIDMMRHKKTLDKHEETRENRNKKELN